MQSPLYFRFFHIPAYQKSNCRIVIFCTDQIVYSIHIKIQLAREFWFKSLNLKFYHHIETQVYMIKQQIKFPGFSSYDNFLLTPYESPSLSQFKKEPGHMMFQCSLQFAFVVSRRE